MNRVVLFFLLFFASLAAAATAPWDTDDMRRRFEVKGEIFVLSADGKRVLYKAAPWSVWRTQDKGGLIENQWSSSNIEGRPLAIRHRWQVLDDGRIDVRIEQYDVIKEQKERTLGPLFEKLVRKEEKTLENLEPITWLAWSDKDRRVVVRFVPGFAEGSPPRTISDVPIAGRDVIISDNEGVVWAQHVTHEGKYCGFRTPRGTLFLSFYPFPGGSEMGIAAGSEMEIRLADKRVVTFRSRSAYLPEGIQAKVYGVYFADRKGAKFPSAGIMDRNEESKFVEAIKTWPY